MHRDEIIGGRARLVGYRFSPRRQQQGGAASGASALAALQADNVGAFAERRLALVPLTPTDWRSADFRQLVSPEMHFLLTPTRAELGDPSWTGIPAEIKAAGGKVAFDSHAVQSLPGLLDGADLVLMDFRAYALEEFERLAGQLLERRPALVLAADGIGAWSEHRLCQSLGIAYSLGGFAVQPDAEMEGEKLGQSRLVLMEMLNLLRSDADPSALAEAAKKDPGVALKVLDMANAPLFGLSTPLASIQQAVMVLGRDMLYRWLSLGVYRAGGSGRDETLLEFALWRARFLELVSAGQASDREREELFMVGMLSLLDSLMGMPMEQASARISLPQPVRDALLSRQGRYGELLRLALAMERGQAADVSSLATALGISGDILENSRIAARAWAEEAFRTA